MNYHDRLAQLPGRGAGLHDALRPLICSALREGMATNSIVADIRSKGDGWDARALPDREIISCIGWAEIEIGRSPTAAPSKPRRVREPSTKGLAVTQQYVEKCAGIDSQIVRGLSPIDIPSDPKKQAQTLLRTLYAQDDILFIGIDRHKPVLRTVRDHLSRIDSDLGLRGMPFVIPNPLTGEPAPKADYSGESLRADRAVQQFRFAVAESDHLPLPEQLAFWSAAPLPVAALIYSGSKSIHAWIKVEGVSTIEEWEERVRIFLYDRRLVPMGFDPATSNPARLSRMPGAKVRDRRLQNLLYLDADPSSTPIVDPQHQRGPHELH